MMKFVIVVCFVVALAAAMPAKSDIDKATLDDTELNDVIPEKSGSPVPANVELVSVRANEKQEVEETTDKSKEATENPVTSKPQDAGSAFARIIDDIFQIPIAVLQSVAKLLTSPFLQNNKPPVAA